MEPPGGPGPELLGLVASLPRALHSSWGGGSAKPAAERVQRYLARELQVRRARAARGAPSRCAPRALLWGVGCLKQRPPTRTRRAAPGPRTSSGASSAACRPARATLASGAARAQRGQGFGRATPARPRATHAPPPPPANPHLRRRRRP
jgi:hypothetical protein